MCPMSSDITFYADILWVQGLSPAGLPRSTSGKMCIASPDSDIFLY